MSQFQQPGIGGDKFAAAEHNGALLLFFPTAYRTDIPTTHGTADAVESRIVNLDTGQVLDNSMVYPRALVGQLKNAAPDGMVLGRLGQGQNQKGNPPWMLFSHTEQDVARAEAWIAANPVTKFAQPQAQSAPPTPPAPGGWGAPAPAPASPAPATGGWTPQAPAPAPAATWTPPAAPAPAPALDPQLVAFLQSKGVDPTGMSQEQAVSIANMLAAQ